MGKGGSGEGRREGNGGSGEVGKEWGGSKGGKKGGDNRTERDLLYQSELLCEFSV